MNDHIVERTIPTNSNLSQDGSTILINAAAKPQIWDTTQNVDHMLDIDLTNARQIDLSHDGSIMAVTRPNAPIEIWETDTGTLLTIIDQVIEAEQQFEIKFSRDNTKIVSLVFTGKRDEETLIGYVKIWDTDSGKLLRNIGYRGDVAVRIDAEGQRVGIVNDYDWKIYGYSDSTARILDVITGNILFHQKTNRSGKFSPDLNMYIANVGDYDKAYFDAYDTRTGYMIFPHGINLSYAGSVAEYSPDNSRLLIRESSVNYCGGDYQSMHLWDILNGKELNELRLGYSYGFNTKGDLLYSASDNNIQFWDAHTGEQLATIIENNGQGNAGITADGTLFVTTGDEGTIRLWGVPAD